MRDLKQQIEDKIVIKGPYSEKDLKAYSQKSLIKSLTCLDQKLVTAQVAKGFSSLQAVHELWIWSSVTRTAMREIIRIPELQVLDLLEIIHPGRLMYFSEAIDLKEFRCNHYMSEADLIEISKIPNLVELGAQGAEISQKSLEALLAMNKLKSLDLEGSEFDDKLAFIMAQSTQINRLEIGASKITSNGFELISNMSQLESLDIWATELRDIDMKCLTKLENLKYLSIGGIAGQQHITYDGIIEILKDMPKLKRLWLDGVELSDQQAGELHEKYEYFRN